MSRWPLLWFCLGVLAGELNVWLAAHFSPFL